jgi:hypothetical protein
MPITVKPPNVKKVKVQLSLKQAVEAPFSRQSAHRERLGCQPYAPTVLYPPEWSPGTQFVRGWVNHQGHRAVGRIRQKKTYSVAFSPQANYTDRSNAAAGEVMPTFAGRSAQLISSAVNLSFLDRSRHLFFPVAPQLSSRSRVDPVPDPLFLRKPDSAGNRTWNLWICSQKLWLDHRDGLKD